VSEDETDAARPVLRIVSGNPTPEELAALTALVTAASSGGTDEAPKVLRGGWRDPARLQRRRLVPGANAWRSSGW
jgi:hypothetical protein